MRKTGISIVLLLLFFSVFTFAKSAVASQTWSIQSIDTMKYSRDLSRAKLNDLTFDQVINNQIELIAETGATHVAVGTPYDEEFIPFLTRWVNASRSQGLNVWFRGNFSGWEGWFGYKRINRDEHLIKTKDFIRRHPELFADGDIFTACTECENGGPGDPRKTGDLVGFRAFLIQEYEITRETFEEIDKNVTSGYVSMNADVAELVMDPETVAALDQVIVIDHYVASPERLISDIEKLAQKTQANIVLGEFGAPIPDIHGPMTEAEQRAWISEVLEKLAASKNVLGLNYWINIGGSTALWSPTGNPKQAVGVLTDYFRPHTITGVVLNEIGQKIPTAVVKMSGKQINVNDKGEFVLTYINNLETITVSAPEFKTKTVTVSLNDDKITILLSKSKEDFLFILRKLAYLLFKI